MANKKISELTLIASVADLDYFPVVDVTDGTTKRATVDMLPTNTGPAGEDGADGADGDDGTGWTGGGYTSNTGVVAFTSNDTGFAFATGDLRGADGSNGSNGDVGDVGATGAGWLATSAYVPATGIVNFTSADGLEFSTGDLRGADGDDGSDAEVTSTNVNGVLIAGTGISLSNDSGTNKLTIAASASGVTTGKAIAMAMVFG